jgi:hypothetical protein
MLLKLAETGEFAMGYPAPFVGRALQVQDQWIDYNGHFNMAYYNVLFDRREGQWRLATILDFDKGWAGHPETDLARLELWTGMVGDGFWPAYRAVRPVADGYAERRPIYQLLWCLEYAQNTSRHLADTAHLCQELGLPAIERFDPEG